MDFTIKYKASGSNQEQQILIPHITRVLYNPDLNQVSIELTSGSAINITTTTENLYESIMEKINKYYLSLSGPKAI